MYGQDLSQVAREAAKAEMAKGIGWLAGGAALTGITYAAADQGGVYVVFWGALAYGGYRFLRALYYWVNPGALVRKAGSR